MMKRFALGLAVLVGAVAGSLSLGGDSATGAGGPPTVQLPADATLIRPGVYSLGRAIHNGHVVDGIAVVDPARALPAKGGIPGPPSNEGPGSGGSGCTSNFIFGSNVNWKQTESWLFDGTNSGIGVSASDMAAALGTWESGAGNVQIFGNLDTTRTIDGADTRQPDDKNEVYFARIVGPGAGSIIAMTIVWQDVTTDEIIAWDMVFNTKFAWALNSGVTNPDADTQGASDKMDFLAIAVHEVGHAAGLDHTSGDCATSGADAPTMAPTASYGDTHQRTLSPTDVDGINVLY